MSNRLSLSFVFHRLGWINIWSKSTKVHHNSNILNNEIDQFEKFCVKNYLLISSSFDCYHFNSLPHKSRIMIYWFRLAYFTLFTTITGLLALTDDDNLYHIFGVSAIPLKHRRVLITILFLCLFSVNYFMIYFIILEKQKRLEFVEIVRSLRSEWRGKLMSKYMEKYCITGRLLRKTMSILVFMMGSLIVVILITLTSIIVFELGFKLSINYMVGTIFCLIGIYIYINHLYCITNIFLLATYYIVLRFKQVRDRIKNSRSIAMLEYSMREHNQICSMNERNNALLSHLVFFLYFFVSIIIDIEVYSSIHIHIIPLKIILILISLIVACGTFLATTFSALLSNSAHSSYKRLNSIMVSRSLTLSDKLNLLNLIERLGGQDIATYCLDLFPINMFQFYLLVANLAKNLLIILDLLPKA